ncbi:MAG: two-component response regulator [Bryobacterales bacterium]|nr:two-component response regulator [Bryobacterales bacterium]
MLRNEKPVGLVGIVDDDQSVRDSISSLLRSVGYRSVEFSSAEAFLSLNHRYKADCLVLDLRMPGGLSGLELHERLLESKRLLPIIFISGHADEDARAKALQRGAVAFLSKPFSEKDLLGAIRSALEASRNEIS